MPFLTTVRLIRTFYGSFAFASLLVSFSCAFLFWKYQFSALAGLCWFKVITLAVLYYFINEYKQKEYYYYHNLGLSKKRLWVSTIGFDFIFFILLLIITHYLKWRTN